jgi:hypothetical protein
LNDVNENRRVFVVYGRNRRAHAAAVLQLRALGADPVDFEHIRAGLRGTPFVGDVVREGLREAPAVLVLLTPDDYCVLGRRYRTESDVAVGRWQPRPNVLLEAGIAFGIDEHRTILATIGDVELPSDLLGRHHVRLDNSPRARETLRNALIASGCILPSPDPRWHEPAFAGDFETAIANYRRPGAASTIIVIAALVIALVLGVGMDFMWRSRIVGQTVSSPDVVKWMEQAEISRERGNYPQEIEWLNKVIASNPDPNLRDYALGARNRAKEYLKALEGTQQK